MGWDLSLFAGRWLRRLVRVVARSVDAVVKEADAETLAGLRRTCLRLRETAALFEDIEGLPVAALADAARRLERQLAEVRGPLRLARALEEVAPGLPSSARVAGRAVLGVVTGALAGAAPGRGKLARRLAGVEAALGAIGAREARPEAADAGASVHLETRFRYAVDERWRRRRLDVERLARKLPSDGARLEAKHLRRLARALRGAELATELADTARAPEDRSPLRQRFRQAAREVDRWRALAALEGSLEEGPLREAAGRARAALALAAKTARRECGARLVATLGDLPPVPPRHVLRRRTSRNRVPNSTHGNR